MSNALRKNYSFEGTFRESSIPNFSNALGKINRFERTTSERKITYFGHTFGNGDFFQACTSAKHADNNPGDALGKFYSR